MASSGPDRFKNVVFATHSTMGGPFVVGSHHLARRLARRGHRVLHVGRPFTPPEILSLGEEATRNRWHTLRSGGIEHEENLLDLVPFSWAPMRSAGLVYHHVGRNPVMGAARGIQRARERFHGGEPVDLLIVDAPRYAGLPERLDPEVTLYRATDLLAEMIGQPTVDELEAALCRDADGLVATSQPVLEHLLDHAPDQPSLLLPNGVDLPHFQQPAQRPPEYESLEPPVAVYVGALDERFDHAGVATMAGKLPGVQVVLIGPAGPAARADLEDLANVHLLGPRPFSQVPAYLQHADVGLLPFSDHPANQGRSPMKLYEYAATGLPVLVRRTDELARRDEPFCRFYDDPSEMASTLESMLEDPMPVDEIQACAQDQDWEAKVDQLLGFAGTVATPR